MCVVLLIFTWLRTRKFLIHTQLKITIPWYPDIIKKHRANFSNYNWKDSQWKAVSSSKWRELWATRFLQPSIQNFNYKARINFTSQWQLPLLSYKRYEHIIIDNGHPTVQRVLLQSFGFNSNPYTILIQTISLQAFLIFVSFFLSLFVPFFPCFPF